MTASEICQTCQQAQRTDAICDAGWIEATPLADGYNPSQAPCKQWQAQRRGQQQTEGLAAAGLNDAKYQGTWADVTLDHRSWLAARELSGKIGSVISQGLNIVMCGPTGTGKTLAAVLICRAAMQAGHTVMKLDWSRFLDGVRDGYNDRTQEPEGKKFDRVCSADLLLLDDVAAGGDDNKYSSARLEKVITRRYDAQLPTIITANLRIQNLRELLGDRAASRVHGRVIELVFDGQKYRETTEKQEVADLVSSIWRGAK